MVIKTVLEQRNQARKLAAKQPQQIEFARSFIGGILVSLYSPSKKSPVQNIEDPLSIEIKKNLSTLNLDMASYLLGSIYTVMLPKEYRSAYGVFYTPPALTERLLDMAEAAGINWCNSRIVDPACGGGAFLAPVVRRMTKALHGQDPSLVISHIEKRLYGLEIDPFSAWMTEVIIEAVLKEELPGINTNHLGRFVRVCNSLQDSDDLYDQFDLVIGNPPYGRVKLEKDERDKWARSLYGHANLYGLFTDLALRLTNKNGAIAYVTPTSFLGGQYFKSLRSLLLTEAPPVEINFISKREGVFTDVLQETLLAVYRRANVSSNTSVSFLEVQENGKVTIKTGGKHPLPRKSEGPWYLPRDMTQVETASMMKHARYRLSDIGFEVSTGPLVWNRHKEKLFVDRVDGSVPLIWAECIDPSGSGKFAFKTTGKNHFPWYLSTKENDSNVITRTCILLQRTSSIEQPRRLVAAALPQTFIDEHCGKVCIENHVNMVRGAKNRVPKVSTETLAVFLNTKVADQIFRCINGSTAVSAYELENMPLPSPDNFILLEKMLENGTPSEEDIENIIRDMYSDACTRSAA